MAVFLAVTALVTVVICAKLFHLNKGLAAGLAGGALTQSAIIGTAGDAIARLGLPADQVKSLQSDVAIAYAVTYVFGSLGAIIVCVNILPKFMGAELARGRDRRRSASCSGGTPSRGAGATVGAARAGRARVQDRRGRRQDGQGRPRSNCTQDVLTIERIKRDGKALEPAPDLVLAARRRRAGGRAAAKAVVRIRARSATRSPDVDGM